MADVKGYAGKIKNTGNQVVEAPYAPNPKRGKTIIKGDSKKNK